MAFIDELMAGPNPLGITYEEPKGDDAINRIMGDERLNQVPCSADLDNEWANESE